MSMTRADAKNYIARVISAVQSQQAQIWAEESLQRAFTDFQLAKNWEFLLKDTSNTRTVGGWTFATNNKTYSSGDVSGLRGLNVGQTIYSSAFTDGVNTVHSITYDETGIPTGFTLTNYPGSNVTAAVTCTDDITIVPGQQDYNLPADFYAPSTTRILGDDGKVIEYVRNGPWYRAAQAADTSGVVEWYSLFNPLSPATTGGGVTKMRLRFPPANGGTIRIEYFRAFDRDSDPLDMPDDYLYKFLDYCRALVLESRAAAEQPAAYTNRALQGLTSAALADAEQVDDEDIGLYSQMDIFRGRRYWPD